MNTGYQRQPLPPGPLWVAFPRRAGRGRGGGRARRGCCDTAGGGARGAAARVRAGLTQTRVCAGACGGRPALTHGRKLRPAGPQHLIWPRRAPPAPRRVPRDGEGRHRGSPDVPDLPAVPAPPTRSALCAGRAAATATSCAAPEGGGRRWAGTRRGGKGGGRGSRRPTAARRLAAESPPRRPIEGRSRPSRCPAANAGRCRRRRRSAPSRCVSPR